MDQTQDTNTYSESAASDYNERLNVFKRCVIVGASGV